MMMPDTDRLRNSWNSSKKIMSSEMIDISDSTRDAACSLSNWPPYSIWYPSGRSTFSRIISWISPTTLCRSRSATLADTTILRCAFSRLIAFGPEVDTISAT